MSLIYSNYPPLKTSAKTYHDTFAQLYSEADTVRIASGYISADALVDLNSLVEAGSNIHIDLTIGMHYFDGLTKQQKEAVETLDDTLRERELGGVNFVVTFPFHGKISSFLKSGVVTGGLVGSSNLTNISENKASRQYEVDYSLSGDDAIELNGFIGNLLEISSAPYRSVEDSLNIIEGRNDLLEELEDGVEKVDEQLVESIKKNRDFEYAFTIPLKVGENHTQSNLNTFNGKGRGKGLNIARSWYEVELITPKEIRDLPGFPLKDTGVGDTFSVITDDGWEFVCMTEGTNGKNLRSKAGLKVLGMWLKGRLERSGALKMGDLCTQETLDSYGRSNILLAKIKDSDKWFMDFEPENK